MKIRLADQDLLADSIVDGEGLRAVIWTQGCSHNCKGCHNPETHDFKGGIIVDIRDVKAFEKIVRQMKEQGIGYGAINHPVDRDPVCGFTGVINDICPGCGRTEADGVKFERIRRITGYLVGTVDRFNNGKRAEEHDRVKHGKA